MDTLRRLVPVLGAPMCLSPRTVVNVCTIDDAPAGEVHILPSKAEHVTSTHARR